MDKLTPEQRHRNMQHIRSCDTGIEKALCSELWNRGVRYRKNVKDIPGKPDIAIKKYKVAVFCDSEFFHGYNWSELKKQLERGSNPDFWIKKIQRNMERDEVVNEELNRLGWTVLRFWGKRIKKNPVECCNEIIAAISNSRKK